MVKNKQNLSLDELLEEALVPEHEWPYKVPKNWVWVRLPQICKYIRAGGDKPKNVTEIKDEKNIIPIVANGIVNDGIIGFTDTAKAERDTITISARGTIGFSVMRDYEYFPIVRLIVIKPHEFVLPKLVKYLFDNFLEEGTGSSIPQLTVPMLNDKHVPLPTLDEQQRIVNRIESLFEKLDQAKGLIQDVLDSFENRKAAILHKAFSGELTRKWREENGIGMESWEEKTLDSVCSSIFDGDHLPPPKSETGVPFLVISNVNKGVLNFENTRFVPKAYFNKLTETRKPQYGDVLYTIVGSYGIPVIVDTEKEFCFQRHMALLKPKHISTKYLWYLLQTEVIYQKVSEIATGTAQLTVPIKGLRQISFKLPTEKEQDEIVMALDKLVGRDTLAYENCDILDSINSMKKSILARAFRGELGTNDPEEESAMELLKSILTDKINTELSTTGKVQKKEKECAIVKEEINMSRTIIEVLVEYKRLTPEKLKALTGIKDIEDFYAELKILVDTGVVIDHREGDESYLEVNNAGR